MEIPMEILHLPSGLFNIAMENPHFLIGKPSISRCHLYHGYVSHNQMVNSMEIPTKKWANPRDSPAFSPRCRLKEHLIEIAPGDAQTPRQGGGTHLVPDRLPGLGDGVVTWQHLTIVKRWAMELGISS